MCAEHELLYMESMIALPHNIYIAGQTLCRSGIGRDVVVLASLKRFFKLDNPLFCSCLTRMVNCDSIYTWIMSDLTCTILSYRITTNASMCVTSGHSDLYLFREGREFAESVDFTLPDDFQVDPTDPELFRACSVSLPAQCRSQLTTDSAPGVVATPLVALLFAVVAKLFA